MADKPMVTRIAFKQVTRDGSLIGFVSFNYNSEFSLTNIAVHERADKRGIRLVYPQNKERNKPFIFPNNRKTQQDVDKIVTMYLQKGAFNDQNPSPESNSNY